MESTIKLSLELIRKKSSSIPIVIPITKQKFVQRMHDNLHDKIHLERYIIDDYYVARRSMVVIIHLYGRSVMHKVEEMT